MLDINYIRDNPDVIKKACKDKQLDPAVVDDLLSVDLRRRELITITDGIKKEINSNANVMKKLVTSGETSQQKGNEQRLKLIEKGKWLKEQLKEQGPQLKETEEKFKELMLSIPNVPADEVPVGENEEGNKVVRTEGDKPNFNFEAKAHNELMEKLDLLDTKRGVKVAGFRAYFLKNEALLLEQAILNYALQLMMAKGFTAMSAPAMVNKEALIGTGFFPWGAEDHYYTQDGQGLAGTAEVAVTSYYGDEVLAEKDLPKKMVGLSPCFRREVGTHGKDTKGIVRVHQFTKVEQVVLTVANEDETRKMHEEILANAEELLKNLGLHYQVLMMCTGDMGAGQRKKYDIETWFPAQNKYRETHSCSYFNDFQARRLNIKYQAKDGSTKFVYTLNNTVAASPRLLAAIVENYQNEDGSITVPEVLRKWVGKDKLS